MMNTVVNTEHNNRYMKKEIMNNENEKVYCSFNYGRYDGSTCRRMWWSDNNSSEGGDSGSDSSWDASNMITAVTREEGSGTRGAFTELFGVVDEDDNDMITLDAQTTNSTSVMMTTVSENEYAIGYISLGSLDDSLVKAVKIDGVDATAENIENGTYKVSRPFNVAVKTGFRQCSCKRSYGIYYEYRGTGSCS